MTTETYSQKCSTEKYNIRRRLAKCSTHDEFQLRRELADSRHGTIDLLKFGCYDGNPVYNRPDPATQLLIRLIQKSPSEEIYLRLHPAESALPVSSSSSCLAPIREIDHRTMNKSLYLALCGSEPEEPSNPVEERPTIIFPDAKKYKANMRKLAKGLENRLGAVKVE